MGIVFLLCAVVTTGAIGASDNRITVEAEGTGSTKMEALKSAWQNAVRQAVGMYMTSKTEMLNDNLTEELAAYSRGQVNSYKTLSESQNNGIWTIKIQANIDRDIMQETVKASKSQNIQIDGGNLAAQIQSQQNKDQDAKDVIKLSDMLNFQEALDYQVSLQPYKINNETAIFARHILKFDLKKFQNWANTLEKFVAQRAIRKDEMHIEPNPAKKAFALINTNDYPLQPNPEMLKQDESHRNNGCYVVNASRNDPSYPYWVGNAFPKSMGGRIGFFLDKTKPVKNTIIFLKNQSAATRYFLSDDAYKDIQDIGGKYKLTFYIEAGNGYDAISEPTQKEIIFGFPPHNWRPEDIFIAPEFYVSALPDGGGIGPVLFVFQKLDIPVYKLAQLKNITGRYTLEPVKKHY